MPRTPKKIEVCLEVGQKKIFASALEWPGWSRSGSDEAGALLALCEYGPRYARVLRGTRLGFHAPPDPSALRVVERLKGNSTTDFGAPGLAPSADERPLKAAELRRLQRILQACWRALDAAAQAAEGKALRVGPRGGGRKLAEALRHVREAEASYTSQMGWKLSRPETDDPAEARRQMRADSLKAMAASASGELPARGPRGGARWTARYFTRRAAWHVLDHTWELEDRIL